MADLKKKMGEFEVKVNSAWSVSGAQLCRTALNTAVIRTQPQSLEPKTHSTCMSISPRLTSTEVTISEKTC